MKQTIFLLALATACAASSASADKITPAQAKDHFGKQTTVCGVVASANFATRSKRQPTGARLPAKVAPTDSKK
jgi:hypothetical protein